MMSVKQILNRSINTDIELKKMAKAIGIGNLEVIWLKDYSEQYLNKPTIINIGNTSTGGTHWVAAYKDQYFDSMGQMPPAYRGLDKKQWAPLQIQRLSQGHCGAYALLFLYYAIRNDIDGFYNIFKAYNIT